MTKENLNLDERLSFAAELVPEGSILLDVGTDHGYLPAKLLLDGKISRAGASDVNPDPLLKAVKTAEKYGVIDKISFYLSDGLSGIPDLNCYTAISICGMGGELIARIISEAEYIRLKKIPLILQPMSSVEDLSIYLAKNGFAITDERIASASGKLYRVILAVYDGTSRVLTPVEHIIGRKNIELGNLQINFKPLIIKQVAKYRRICDGKRSGGIDFSEEDAILRELFAIAHKEGLDFENM